MDIIDLEKGVDGTYHVKEKNSVYTTKSKKISENMDAFFNGVDIGLSFIEEVDKRIDRFLKFRNKR